MKSLALLGGGGWWVVGCGFEPVLELTTHHPPLTTLPEGQLPC